MTPTQLDHLRLIDAHLERLLDIASKRTPGEWKVNNSKHGTIVRLAKNTVGEPQDVCRAWNCSRKDGNATFIVSCAGNAEAGWKATRAAIATALNCESWDYMIKEMYIRQDAEAILESILAAFPLETISVKSIYQ